MRASTAVPGRAPVAAAPTPWGRWGVRATAATYLLVMIALPLAAVIRRGLAAGLTGFWADVTSPFAIDALRLTVLTAGAMSVVNAVMGTATAFVLVRCPFRGRRVLDAVVDLPFALPTLVTGVMLVALYGPQTALGGWLEGHGLRVIYAAPGIMLALLFVGYPFVVRSVQPVFLGAQRVQEEAAYTLGASRLQTFRRVLLPAVAPAVLSGSLLAFARALGEFGSIVVVAGNIPGRTLTAPVYLFQLVEADDTRGAGAVSLVLLALSFSMLVGLDALQRRRQAVRVGR